MKSQVIWLSEQCNGLKKNQKCLEDINQDWIWEKAESIILIQHSHAKSTCNLKFKKGGESLKVSLKKKKKQVTNDKADILSSKPELV